MKRKKPGTNLLATCVCKRVTLLLCQDGHRQDAVSSHDEIHGVFCLGGDAMQATKDKRWYWMIVSAVSALILSVQLVMADDIWSRFSSIMRDVYGQIVGISTIVGVTAAAIALIVRMISRNQRAVDEATQWLKRIVITWIILNTLGFAVAYLQPLIAGGNYTG